VSKSKDDPLISPAIMDVIASVRYEETPGAPRVPERQPSGKSNAQRTQSLKNRNFVEVEAATSYSSSFQRGRSETVPTMSTAPVVAGGVSTSQAKRTRARTTLV
jgi:hypothetical protein